MRTFKRLDEVGCATAVLAVGLAVFVAFASQDWPGAPHECLAQSDCYCEAPRPGWIRQPANTWSCLAGAVVGFAIAIHSRSRRSSCPTRQQSNRMASSLFYPTLYASIMVYSAVGAGIFHGSLTDWGGKLDMMSMHLVFGFWFVYNLTRWFDRTVAWFLIVLSPLTVALLVPRVLFGVMGFEIFAVLLLCVIASEILVGVGARGRASPLVINRSWLWVSLGLYPPALLIWYFSLSGQPLCNPRSLFQGHAVWHVLTALSPGALYLYFRNGELGEPAA